MARPWGQPRLESPKVLDAREVSFIAVLDDVHEQNLARRALLIPFVISDFQKPECLKLFYAYRHRDGRIGNILKEDPERLQ